MTEFGALTQFVGLLNSTILIKGGIGSLTQLLGLWKLAFRAHVRGGMERGTKHVSTWVPAGDLSHPYCPE